MKLNFTLDEVRGKGFSSRSRESVPHAIVAFLEGNDYESTVRKAISIGGDSDTIACMAGGIAEALTLYGLQCKALQRHRCADSISELQRLQHRRSRLPILYS